MPQQSNEAEVTMFEGMRRLVSGVSVITAQDQNGRRFAMTATSVTSVSGEPPSLLVCINRQARIHTAITTSETFAVNVLGAEHQNISTICALPETAAGRFAEGAWQHSGEFNVPYLEDAQAVFFCRKVQSHVYGTHTIFVANVEQTYVAKDRAKVLAYMNGGYVNV